MQKISSKDASSLLKTAGATIRSLVQENGHLKSKVASMEREERIAKIAQDMDEKGLNNELSTEEKVAALRQAKDLDVAEQAVKMASPQGVYLGDISEVPGGGMHPFESFILTGEE